VLVESQDVGGYETEREQFVIGQDQNVAFSMDTSTNAHSGRIGIEAEHDLAAAEKLDITGAYQLWSAVYTNDSPTPNQSPVDPRQIEQPAKELSQAHVPAARPSSCPEQSNRWFGPNGQRGDCDCGQPDYV
jgi:hypothetical protein